MAHNILPHCCRIFIFLKIAVHFLLFYSILMLFSLPILATLLYRFLVQKVFATFYHGKYTLIKPADILYDLNRPRNVLTITTIFFMKNPCELHQIRKRLRETLFQRNASGQRPYHPLLCTIVRKFGYTCFEDKSSSMDFTHHVRLCPGADHPDRIYSENEMLDSVSKFSNDSWSDDDNHPRWELLVVPKVLLKKGEHQSEEQVVCAGLVLRVHHVYCDGIAVFQFCRNCLFDQPAPKLMLDPVNPPLPPVPLWKKIMLGLQVVFMGPSVILGPKTIVPDPVFHAGPLGTGKIFGRTTMHLPLEMMRRIRKAHHTNTDSILHAAFTGALRGLAMEKGYEVRDETFVGITKAALPYPNEYPGNRLFMASKQLKIGIADPLARLAAVTDSLRQISAEKYALVALSIMLKFFAIFPRAIANRMYGSLNLTYVLSNIPGSKDVVRLNGNVCLGIFGVPPNGNGISYAVGVGCYGGKFCASFSAEKSKIVSSREDMDKLVDYFENEIKLLDMLNVV